MPVKNAVKKYVESGTYHIYNRGNSGNIFHDEEDYLYFVFLLEEYLLPPPKFKGHRRNFVKKITLYAYCLMPTHMHLLIKQCGRKDIGAFLQSLSVSYSLYLHHRYQKRGPLFESVYKARLIETDGDFVNVAYYIHRNPSHELMQPSKYPYSSLRTYIKLNKVLHDSFVKTGRLLTFFNGSREQYEKHITLGDTLLGRDPPPGSLEF